MDNCSPLGPALDDTWESSLVMKVRWSEVDSWWVQGIWKLDNTMVVDRYLYFDNISSLLVSTKIWEVKKNIPSAPEISQYLPRFGGAQIQSFYWQKKTFVLCSYWDCYFLWMVKRDCPVIVSLLNRKQIRWQIISVRLLDRVKIYWNLHDQIHRIHVIPIHSIHYDFPGQRLFLTFDFQTFNETISCMTMISNSVQRAVYKRE